MSSGKFKELKIYLKALPETLPVSGPMSKLNRLLGFAPDEDWVNDGQQTTLTVKKGANPASEDSDSEGKSSEMNTPDDPVEDPLNGWMKDCLTFLPSFWIQSSRI